MKVAVLQAPAVSALLPAPADSRGGQIAVPDDISASEEVMHLPF
jgi:hypothetical protein